LRRPVFTRMLAADAKQRMPAIFLAQANHRRTAKSPLANDGTVSGAQMGGQALESGINTLP
jgi:hypothetical protein